ncbi:MAG TPA: hypothetical protein VGF62_05470 [Rhizomicrobium sp.]
MCIARCFRLCGRAPVGAEGEDLHGKNEIEVRPQGRRSQKDFIQTRRPFVSIGALEDRRAPQIGRQARRPQGRPEGIRTEGNRTKDSRTKDSRTEGSRTKDIRTEDIRPENNGAQIVPPRRGLERARDANRRPQAEPFLRTARPQVRDESDLRPGD